MSTTTATENYTVETIPAGGENPECDECGMCDAVVRVNGRPLCRTGWAHHPGNAALVALSDPAVNRPACIVDAETMRERINTAHEDRDLSPEAEEYLTALTDEILRETVENELRDGWWEQFYSVHTDAMDKLLKRAGFTLGGQDGENFWALTHDDDDA